MAKLMCGPLAILKTQQIDAELDPQLIAMTMVALRFEHNGAHI
jgi:hypothetical protein